MFCRSANPCIIQIKSKVFDFAAKEPPKEQITKKRILKTFLMFSDERMLHVRGVGEDAIVKKRNHELPL